MTENVTPTRVDHTCHAATFLGTPRGLAQSECPACQVVAQEARDERFQNLVTERVRDLTTFLYEEATGDDGAPEDVVEAVDRFLVEAARTAFMALKEPENEDRTEVLEDLFRQMETGF